MEDRNNSTYRGYKIVRAWHPRPGDTRRMAWDVVCDGKVRRENIGSTETAKRLIDTMIKYGYWPDKTTQKARGNRQWQRKEISSDAQSCAARS